jgi:flagellar hook assembly protein FlgD
MGFVISHRGPALISAVIQDEEGRTVRRLLSRKLTRPEQLYPEGTTLYWDGKNHRGERVEAGTYRLYVRLEQGGEVQEVLSRDFRLLSMEDTPENNDNA